MKRDMDLVRKILLRLESIELSMGAILLIDPSDAEYQFEGYSIDQVDYHVNLIFAAGFVDTGCSSQPMTGIAFRGLTWEGHEFVDSIRDDEVWEKTQRGFRDAGGFTLDLVKDLAKGFIRKQVEDRTGIKL